MQLHELKPKQKTKKRKRRGRGGKRGTYSGRGIKGQKARAGRKLKPSVRELIKRYPKLRGYRRKSKIQNLKSKMVILNLDILEKKFDSGDKITPQTLLEKKIIRRIKGEVPKVKILAKGKLTKKLIIENCEMSQSAQKAIKLAGQSSKTVK